jgi:hypothetical protein
MRIAGFLVAMIIIAWVVGTLVSLYIQPTRHRDDRLPDRADVERRQRMLEDAKHAHWHDRIPPW